MDWKIAVDKHTAKSVILTWVRSFQISCMLGDYFPTSSVYGGQVLLAEKAESFGQKSTLSC